MRLHRSCGVRTNCTTAQVGTAAHRRRWHPSCLFVRRAAIVSRYFGPVPVDHFWMFGGQFDPLDLIDDLGLGGTFEHLRGTAQNSWLIESGQGGIFRPARFARYLADCLAVQVPLHPGWVARHQPYAAGDLSTPAAPSLREGA